MSKILKIALRNIMRYKRRTLFTTSLIAVGVIFVLVFVSISGSFKNMMISQITDSMIGHIQVHRKGYVASIETLPLNLNLKMGAIGRLERILDNYTEIESYSPRIKLTGMFSNFTETSSIRINAIIPEKEYKTTPLLPKRVIEGKSDFKQGEVLIPELLAKGMKIKCGDLVVIVATNKDGSVNGKQFKVSGIVQSATGPGGRDGYIHFNDAKELLRMEDPEISEYAIRLKNFSNLSVFSENLMSRLAKELNMMNKPIFEVHTWEKLSPFYNIAKMIDVMTFFIKIMLIAIVLISILNVMIMAVYERIRDIGTMIAIGTPPSKILNMFLIEGLCLGVIGSIVGNIAGVIIVMIINSSHITFNFGQQKGILLKASISFPDIIIISATVIVVSILASLQPAFKASRMEPIKALRHV